MFTRQGKLLYADKQMVQDLIDQQRINLADVSYLDLNRINIILNSFVNSQAENSGESPWGTVPILGGLSPIDPD